MPPEEIIRDVELLNRAVFGDRENPKDSPGILAELTTTNTKLDQMNDILKELTGSVKWITRLILGAFVTALIALVMKVPVQ